MASEAEIARFIETQIFPESARNRVREGFAQSVARGNRDHGVAVLTENPAQYIGEFLAAFAANRAIFCFNPRWQENELREANSAKAATCASAGDIFIATGGTGGRIRFIRHTAQTFFAAAAAQNSFLAENCRQPAPAARANDFAANSAAEPARREPAVSREFPAARIHYYSPLPPWHVSGLMPLFRCIAGGGFLQICDASFAPEMPLPAAPANPAGAPEIYVLSLVPTQLYRLLQRAEGAEWLRKFDCVLAGGAALPADLVETARRERIPLAIGYGMTETAAFVAAQPPREFLAAAPHSPCLGQILPHAHIHISCETAAAQTAHNTGRIGIAATSLAPDCGENVSPANGDSPAQRVFWTQDEGTFQNNRLRILGRIDRYICTGGEKVDPRRVEAAILECPLAAAALVVDIPNPEWGACVVAIVELWGGYAACDWQATLSGFVSRKLSPPFVPKRWHQVARLPFDEKGKLDHAALRQILAQ